MTAKRQAWLWAFLYIGFIYATLGVVRGPINFLRENGVLILTLNSIFAAAGISIFFLLYKRSGFDLYRIGSFIAIIAAYYIISKKVSSPEEQIHFLQYGLVGVLFIRALRFHTRHPIKKYSLAILISSIAGWIDEVIQGVLPNRHYDLNDIYLNIGSAGLGLLIYALIPPKQGK